MRYPELVIDWRVYPKLADNIWHAQMAGHPKVLTYNGPDLTIRRAQRKAAMHYEHHGQTFEIPHILSRDEYPFASTVQGGGGAWIGHIPGRLNSSQGGILRNFYRQSSPTGLPFTFRVSVINHPRGPVPPP